MSTLAIRNSPILALSLWEPWLWAIDHLPELDAKRIENRRWEPYPWILGRYLCLHAAQQYDLVGAVAVEAEARRSITAQNVKEEMPRGVIRCVARIDRVVPPFTKPTPRWHITHQHGWVIGDLVKLPEPVACRGWQKIWRVPPGVDDRVLVQLPREVCARMATPPQRGLEF